MRLRKIEIAIPNNLLLEVDRVAQMRGESRDRFITRILQEYVHARRDLEVTRRLDEVFAEPDVVRQQIRGATELDAVGTDWNDETW